MQAQSIFLQIEEQQHLPPGADVLMNRETLKRWKLSVGRTVTVSFGLQKVAVQIGIHTAAKSIVLIRRPLADRLCIPYSMNIRAQFLTDKNELQIGPVLGILISKNTLSTPEFVEVYGSFCQEIFEAAQKKEAFCFVTNLDSIFITENHARGWILQDGIWQEATLPLPHVFYNRLGNRMRERSGVDYDRLQSIKASGIAVFNEQFIDKWEVHQLLSLTPMRKYLPVTIKYTTYKSLLQMLRSFPVLFIKPIHGSEGRGILRLYRSTPNQYTLDQITMNGMERHSYKKVSEVVKYVSTKLKKKSYLIQQGINFVESSGMTVDFRVLLQKSRVASWKIVSLVARLGSPRTFVSNLAQGGKLESAGKLLKELRHHYPTLPNTAKLKAIALEIAAALDGQLDGNYGEYGIDLGVDTHGQIWLIEVNSKPSKRNDAILEASKGPRPSVLHLYEYVSYLSGFGVPSKARR